MTADNGEPQPQVFISYRRQDTGQVVSRLLQDLAAAIGENRIFYDRENLQGGDRWKERLKEEISRCSAFLALIGKGWLRARNEESGQRRLDEPEDWVRSELELALETSRSTELLIVPLLVDDAKMPKRPYLPKSIQGILDHQALPLRTATRREWNGDLQVLLARLGEEGSILRAAPDDPRSEAWLAAHLQDVAARFVRHMAASELKPGTQPEELYLDLVVTERIQEKEPSHKDQAVGRSTYPLEDVLNSDQSPLLLIGEGGAGKTTSLLYAAARAADRAKADQAAAIPIYVNLAQLTKIEDVPDLHQLIADSVPLITSWEELSSLGIAERRRFLFMFDSFNEIPEQLQRTCALVLQRFVEAHRDRHIFLIGSRVVPPIEQLARPPSIFKAFEILRLSSDQVSSFLEELDLGSLYERMPRELRELAGNPFMLLAIARTLAGAPESALPRNRGKLYQRFVSGWMDNEEGKRQLEYSYERVKEPLLAYLAKRMTSAGQTSLALTDDIEEGIERQLEETYQRIKRRGGMPAEWTVDDCLDEILGDGLLKQVSQPLHFVHQSVQEYFTALYFGNASPDALVDFTPKLSWEFVSTYELVEEPNHRFAPPLIMMVGWLDDSTKIVEALVARNPILAAAAISSANQVDGSLLARLEQSWLDLLEHDELRDRIVACSCLALASMASRRVIPRLLAMALESDYRESKAGRSALKRLSSGDAITLELIERVLNLPNDEYEERKWNIGLALRELQTGRMVSILFEQWRASPPDSMARHRFEALLASVDNSLLNDELQTIATSASDPKIANDAERALAEAASWRGLGQLISVHQATQLAVQARRQYIDRVAAAVARMSNVGDQELAAALRSTDPAVRAGAAKAAAERRVVAVGDAILESLLQFEAEGELVSALVSLWGEDTAVSRLVERSREECLYIGNFSPELAQQLGPNELSEALKAEIEQLGVSSSNLMIVDYEADGPTPIWLLSPSSWSEYRPRYQIRVLPDRLEFYDCNVTTRAFSALAEIPGEASHTELQRAIEHDDSDVQQIAITALARRGDQHLAEMLIAELNSARSADFVRAALDALKNLGDRRALSLLNDLLLLTDGEWSDVHPVWGPCPTFPGWGDAIHGTLVKLNADSAIQQALDKALNAKDVVPKVAALKELSRWFAEADLGPERSATWRTRERVEQLRDLALSDPIQSVRTAAGGALGKLESEFVQESLAEELADGAAEMQVAAAEALVLMEAQEMYGRVTDTMLQVAKAHQAQNLRLRAGRVLSSIPDGVVPLYQPIQRELERGEPERALELIEATLDIIPQDANLFWWRGHALISVGRLDQAADSYQRAFELEERAPMIPQALAQTFLELGDYRRAMENAQRGVEIDPSDADSQSLLAWSSYKTGAIQEAVEAASKAVDLDPVHSDAIWIVLLGHVRQANLGESRSALHHALRVRQLLSPDLDTSFVADFLEELDKIKADTVEISQLMEEIKEVLPSESE
jgi:tetratricopeptide (TPR) repeat protein